MKRTFLTGATALLLAGTANAHTGAHGKSVFTEIAHWLSSPVHSAGTFIALAALAGAVIYLRHRNA